MELLTQLTFVGVQLHLDARPVASLFKLIGFSAATKFLLL
jgi:hypothetical protein